MGGLWVDYDLQSTVPGLFVGGEANFSDHGANRLGASALMQGLADGYFVLPVTVSNFLASQKAGGVDESHAAVRQTVSEVEERINKLLSIRGRRTPDSFHRELGQLVWDQCGMARTAAGLEQALAKIPQLREEFWGNLSVPGTGQELNQSLEKAGRVADFLEFSELMCRDALERNESAGGHFREEFQTDDGEAKRNDTDYSYVAAWEYTGDVSRPKLNKEPLTFEYVHPSQRSYK
jgi:succinate dehydrogenase / fumarate reductase flavoprotein subunit